MADDQPDTILVLKEVIRQGERTLRVQETAWESSLRRAGELLRLTIAALAGVIVVGGILATINTAFTTLSAVLAVLGVLLVVLAAVLLSVVLAGTGESAHLACGPDFQRLVLRLRESVVLEDAFLQSLVSGLPEWLEENERMIARIQRFSGYALLALSTGSVCLLGALFYISGGAIHG